MKTFRFYSFFALFLTALPILYAVPVEDKTSDEILSEVRISRIPKIIEVLEEMGLRAYEMEQLKEAKIHFQKALVLRQAIGMKQTEGSAHILTKVSAIESKLGNRCEASKLQRLAIRIYRQMGVNFGAVRLEEEPVKVSHLACAETISWLRD
ncbi:tetratricopeptide repeat protein [Leptospira ognonensis]|uniref:Tetratricopeptide repeat protein n=1 Tax=Leptospira ognonensis TaxID=2484945 RepID=A0A4R9JYF0_9LEPT|nr:tetratricopeptide repeat protein [Leptospira ognonensis]TGL56638.1 tetratricopeptide repeat protein [Leptospira ognonensis]